MSNDFIQSKGLPKVRLTILLSVGRKIIEMKKQGQMELITIVSFVADQQALHNATKHDDLPLLVQ